MTARRNITALGLCLFLALTSIGLAVARGAPQPVGQIVLCTGAGVISMAVDAEGVPMDPPHICPDCLLALYDATPRAAVALSRAAGHTARRPFANARHETSLARPAPLARAPPRPA